MNKARECPFCPAVDTDNMFRIVPDDTSDGLVVTCLRCGAQGPTTSNSFAAQNKWNVRSVDKRIAELEDRIAALKERNNKLANQNVALSIRTTVAEEDKRRADELLLIQRQRQRKEFT